MCLIWGLLLKINKLVNKQKELEFVLIQSCNEREKQAKIIDELSNKFIMMENEKNELEQIVMILSIINY